MKSKVIFIYGPPASGKLTIAKELAKITSLKVFHNHLVFDMMTPIVPFKLEENQHEFWKVNNEIKRMMMELAMKEKVSIIITFCYSHPWDKELKKFVKTIKKNEGEAHFVRLNCSKETLFKRVKNKSRKKFGKVKKIKDLKKGFRRHEFFEAIRFQKSYEIKNDNVSAKKVAKMIKEHYKL